MPSAISLMQWCGASRHCLALRQPRGTFFTALASVSTLLPQSCSCLEAPIVKQSIWVKNIVFCQNNINNKLKNEQNVINQDDFSSDDHPNVFANKEYILLHPAQYSVQFAEQWKVLCLVLSLPDWVIVQLCSNDRPILRAFSEHWCSFGVVFLWQT